MKTPREILLERHQHAKPKLDVIRHQVVESTRRPSILGWPILLWRELVWPCRRIWAGLTAVWVLLLVVNFSMRDHSPAIAGKSAPTAAEIVLTWQQQQQLLAELIGPDELRTIAPAMRNPSSPDHPKPISPRSSSELQLEILMT